MIEKSNSSDCCHGLPRWLKRIFLLLTLTAAAVGLANSPSAWAVAKNDPVKYALLIGIDNYPGDKIPSLQGAKNDVNLIADILVQRFEFKPENIKRLLDQDATHRNIQLAFETLIATAKQDDTIYIHYSGHGSYICDLNRDETTQWGKDSTWVSYGARTAGLATPQPADCDALRATAAPQKSAATPAGLTNALDDFDILDDEISAWLTALGAKTDQIIFVSDSCHSGTVTRGMDAVRTRAIAADIRFHPLGKGPVISKPMPGLRVTACRDDELASEYRASGRMHGAFTWFWSQSLMNANPHETWGDIYKRAAARLRNAGGRQHPQIEGPQDTPTFGGQFSHRLKTIAVDKVSADGRRAIIAAGALVGVTKGSIYIKYDPQSPADQQSTLKITRTRAVSSTARVKGELKVGDLVTLAHYQHPQAPIRVFVAADLAEDRFLVSKIREIVTQLRAFELIENQSESSIVLRVLRPERNERGDYAYARADHALPVSGVRNMPECWVLTPDERLYQEKLRIPMQPERKALNLLYTSLKKLARIRNMINLESAPGQEIPIDLEITIWREDELGDPDTQIEVGDRYWQPVKKLTAGKSEQHPLKVGQLLTFNVSNRFGRGYYVYLVDITADGQIIPFYPTFDQSKEAGFVPAGASHTIEEVTLLIDAQGREYIRLIASLKPIDIYLLEQQEYQTRAAQTNLNPLEALLCARAGLTRGKIGGPIAAAEWTTVLAAFEVSR